MKTRHLILIAIVSFSVFLLAGCALFNNNKNQSVEDKLGEKVLGVMAYYLDDSGNVITNDGRLKEIIYGDDFNFYEDIEVRAVGRMGKFVTIREKTDKEDGYTIEISKYSDKDDEILYEVPEVFEWANYTFEFKYGDMSYSLFLNVERADFLSCGCELVLPEQTYNEGYKTPYVTNLPINDDVSVEMYYTISSAGITDWTPWEFVEGEKNTVFLPTYAVGVKAVITAPNYFKQEFTEYFTAKKYSLKGQMELSHDSLEMQYLVSDYYGRDAKLSAYDLLLQRNLTAAFDGKEIDGTFEFVDGEEVVKSLGNATCKIRFTNAQSDYYVSEEHEYDITVNFTKFKVVKPIMQDTFINYVRTSQTYIPSGYTFVVDIDEEMYNLYYYTRHIVDLDYEPEYWPGGYPCTLVLADKEHCEWEDGGTEDVETTWVLKRGSLNLSTSNLGFSSFQDKQLTGVTYKVVYDSQTQTYSLSGDVIVNDGEAPALYEYMLLTDGYTWEAITDVGFSYEICEEDADKINGYTFKLTDEGLAAADEDGYVTIHGKIVISQIRYSTSPIKEISVCYKVKVGA